MLDTNDKNWIIQNFVTKNEFTAGVNDIKESMTRVEDLSKKTLAVVEGLSGKVADLDQENKMGSVTLHRHEMHISELAKAAGTTLSS